MQIEKRNRSTAPTARASARRQVHGEPAANDSLHDTKGKRLSDTDGFSGQYFADFNQHVHVGRKDVARMGDYMFLFERNKATNGLQIQVDRLGQRIVQEQIPSAFYMGDLQAASLQVYGQDYLLLAANSRRSAARRWFAIYRADGHKMYAASLDKRLAHVRQNEDGVSLLFLNGDSMRIKLMARQ